MKRYIGLRAFMGVMLACVPMMTMAACNDPAGMDVSSAYGKGIKYAGIGKNYDWAPASMQAGDQFRPVNPELDAALTRIIDGELAKKGFTRVSSGSPDFFLRDGVFRENKTDSNVNPFGVPYEKGSLFVDVLNPPDGKVIWRGVAQAKLDDSASPADRERMVTAAVRALVKDFPAQTAPKH